MNQPRSLGLVSSGTLSKGLTVRLQPGVSVEDIKVGQYVVIDGERRRFFGLITDVHLASLSPQLGANPPDVSDPFTRQVLAGTAYFGELTVLPQLSLGMEDLVEGPQPAKSIPPHFSPVREAAEEDVARIFGREDATHFYIGNPLDMETKVCLDLPELVKRSNGVFGKSGTGKTFLTRLLLIGILQKRAAVNLVFDMHNEYGWRGTSEGGREVKGLKQLFPSQVAVFTLDAESATRRRISADLVAQIGYDEVEPEDMELLRQTLNLTQPACEAAYSLAREFGDRRWLSEALKLQGEDARDLLERLNIHEQSFRNLRRGLERLSRLSFLVPQAQEKAVPRLMEYLERGMHVVLEFGRYSSDLTAYVLVANILTRRIHDRYRELTERYLSGDGQAPRPLVITIEEAHRFLNPEVASQTIFGAIAREMRKYYVTLLVVDQRPSGIDEEVMSQLGTRATYLLDSEPDVDRVLAGVPGKAELKTVLFRLESRQQVLFLGHAVPMPIVVRTRDYGTPQSYQELGSLDGPEARARADREMDELFGK